MDLLLLFLVLPAPSLGQFRHNICQMRLHLRRKYAICCFATKLLLNKKKENHTLLHIITYRPLINIVEHLKTNTNTVMHKKRFTQPGKILRDCQLWQISPTGPYTDVLLTGASPRGWRQDINQLCFPFKPPRPLAWPQLKLNNQVSVTQYSRVPFDY